MSVPLCKLSAGRPSPLGATLGEAGVNFALFSAHATRVILCLFSEDGKTEIEQIELPSRTGDIWHGFVGGLKAGQLYGYRVDGPYSPHDGHRFNANKLLIDPYARTLFGEIIQNEAIFGYDPESPDKDLSFDARNSAPFMPKCVVSTAPKPVSGRRPNTSWAETIIYESHVKGLTMRHPQLQPSARGTFSGLKDPAIIKHLTSLGISAIELLPVQSFFTEPRLTGLGLTNYWGYNPVNYFAAHADYGDVSAFKSSVEALHAAGIEVILDVVYNHTAESDELGPTLSYRGIDNLSYYGLQDEKRYYVNHTGTGNTLAMTHPKVLALSVASLRYWVEFMGVDGFRFDLASTLARGSDGFDQKSDFLLACKQDPVLSTIKLIAEPWDIGPGGYALGQFPKGWTEWNDRFRDDVRSFWRGDSMAHKALAGRLLGSADHFDHSEKSAQSSVNFVTSHDGFTLKDVVSYNEKHNHANGEENRDGHGHNLSENMGVEGPSDDSEIIAARHRRSRNLLATLMLSQGTPMLLAGDEFGHSQGGNNNTYCQDNEITWLDWGGSDDALKDFTADLIALRKSKPHFSQEDFLHGQTLDNITAKNAIWLSPHGGELHGGAWDDHALTCLGLVLNLETDGGVLIIFNRGEAQRFAALTEKSWTFELSTAGPFQDDIIPAHCISVFSLAHTYQTPEQELANLKKKTEAYNFISEFRDISGQTHQADPITLRKLINALETTPPQPYPKIDIKTQIFGVEILRKWGGVWGVTCGLYGLRSERSWGIGDFEDLAVLAEHMAEKGADFIGLNPVHALFPSAPHLYSPYSPSSREFLNVMHIAPDKIPELLDAKRPASFDSGDDNLVDYADVYRHKRKAFEQAFLSFQALSKSHSRVVAFHEFCDSKGEALSQHALFDVIFEALPKSQQNYDGYYNFAKEFQEPINRACQKFESQNTDRILYYKYLQWIAHIQLAEAQRRAESAGMRVGLYLDFAVGVVPGGSDAWRYQTAFARGVSLGAPGDMANPDGQKWDLLPFNPHALIKQKFVPLQRALKANMEIGGALRIDHVLGMQRSFLIPEHGGAGAYLRFPFEALLKLISDLSNETSCVIFGEDLGTVPDNFRRQMAEWKLMGCSILLIERTSSGDIIPLDDLREMAVTAFSNHDFPTLSGFWAGDDFVWRESLGIGSDPNVLAHEKQAREQDKNVLSDVSNLNGKPEYLNSQAMAKLQSWLATAPSLAFAVPLEDIMLDRQQPNVPGTTDEQPNWRRRSKLSLETLKTDVSCNEILDTLAAARPRRP